MATKKKTDAHLSVAFVPEFALRAQALLTRLIDAYHDDDVGQVTLTGDEVTQLELIRDAVRDAITARMRGDA